MVFDLKRDCPAGRAQTLHGAREFGLSKSKRPPLSITWKPIENIKTKEYYPIVAYITHLYKYWITFSSFLITFLQNMSREFARLRK